MGGCLLNENLPCGRDDVRLGAPPPDPRSSASAGATMWLERLDEHRRWSARLDGASAPRRLLASAARSARISPRITARSTPSAAGPMPIQRRAAAPRRPARPAQGADRPWAHAYPHARAGPRHRLPRRGAALVGPLAQGIDTGIMDEPMLRAWMQEACRRARRYPERPGRWVAEPDWPAPAAIEARSYALNPGAARRPGAARDRRWRTAAPEHVGTHAGP